MASPDNTNANDLMVWLVSLMRLFNEARKLGGKVYASRVALRLDDRNGPEPDIVYVARARLPKVRPGHIDGPCDAAVEIVSPESIERDYGKKHELYERMKVPEYWIIDEVREKVFFFRLGPKGKYQQVRPKNGVLHSKVIPGFWLRSEWFWQSPLPSVLETLQLILAGPDAPAP